MDIVLRDYQIDIAQRGVELLRKYGIVYLAMEVRTGKTLTALKIAELYEAKHVLFCTKKKVIADIESQKQSTVSSFDMLTINYEGVQKATAQKTFDILICDEAHGLGAFPTPSQRARQIKEIAAGLPIIFLSGTPSPESYSQLFHQFWVSSFSPWKNYTSFYKWAKDYVTVRKKYIYNRQINDYSFADKARIDSDTKHLFISFTQAEAGFTEFVDEQLLNVRMSDKTYRITERLRKDRIVTNKDGELIVADTAVKLMNKLHQLYSGSVILEDEQRTYRVIDDTKAKFIKMFFAGQRIGIFYKFISEGEMLKTYFNWTTSAEEFNDSTDKTYISQIQSGREGVNLSTADALVMFNIDYSATSYWQVRARLQTKDRSKVASVFWVFSEGGIEWKIYDAVKAKQDFTLSHFRKNFLGAK